MTNVLIPLAYVLLTIGKPINIRNYNIVHQTWPIYNKTDVVEVDVSTESTLSSFNASYYVLPDEYIPNEKVRVPIDYLVRAKLEGASSVLRQSMKEYKQLTSRNTDNALVLVVAECKTSEKTVKENANPTPNWQDRIRERDHETHFAEKIVYGGQVISLVRLRSSHTGDIQVFRRILKDIMGRSGNVTADTVELWKKAEKTIRESPDIRGEVVIDQYTEVINANFPSPIIRGDIEKLFRYVSELPKYTETSRDDRRFRYPLYVSFKPLNDLDPRFPAVQKNAETEGYMTQLYRYVEDAEITVAKLRSDLARLTAESQLKYRNFYKYIQKVGDTLRKVSSSNSNAYETIDKAAVEEAIKQYKQGLDNSTVNYLAQFRRLREQIATFITCGGEFYSLTSGMLRVLDNEVVKKGKVENFEKCIDFCVEDDQCRAIGYSDEECLVYYRSTNSAVITSASGDMKIYDRICQFIYDDDY